MATSEGLKAKESDPRRRTVFVCVAASVGTEAQAQSFMEKQWRRVTCDQAVERLMGPDHLVTNRKDKEVQVQVLKNLNKQTVEFVTTFFATFPDMLSLPLPTAFDKFLPLALFGTRLVIMCGARCSAEFLFMGSPPWAR